MLLIMIARWFKYKTLNDPLGMDAHSSQEDIKLRGFRM